MSNCRIWMHLAILILFIASAGSAWADNSNREVLPAPAMSGIITGSFEAGKILLASNDKIVVELLKNYDLKLGDYLEIFEPLDPKKKEEDPGLFKKIGLGIVIEKIDPQKVICVIDSSIKEVTLGNLVRVVNPR